MTKVRTCLWYNGDGVEAAEFYTSLLPNSSVDTAFSPDGAEPPLVIDFTLAGTPYQMINMKDGPDFRHSEAASISVLTEDQEETDRLWDALTADGGKPVQCGWLTDRWGLSWQIVPRRLMELQSSGPDDARIRVRDAMLKMVKIEIATLEAAARGE